MVISLLNKSQDCSTTFMVFNSVIQIKSHLSVVRMQLHSFQTKIYKYSIDKFACFFFCFRVFDDSAQKLNGPVLAC